MNNKVKLSMHNKFLLEVVDCNTNEVKQKAQAYNIVCDNLWHYVIETTTAFATYIQYGSGSGTPSASDTSLFTREGGAGITEVGLSCDYVNKLITRVSKIVLGLSDAVGVTITEVGMAAGSGNGSLSTHAMLQDMNGNPISIEKTDTDIINIYATIYCHWNMTDSDITVFHPGAGLQAALTGRSNIFGNFSAGVGINNYWGNNSQTWNKSRFSVADKTITYTMPRYAQDVANLSGGIEWILGSGNYEGIGVRKGTKSWSAFSIEGEAVGTGDGSTNEFRTKFSFPYNATVYVNGVAQTSSQVTVKKQSMSSNYFVSLGIESTEDHFDYYPCFGNANKLPFILYNPDYEDCPVTSFSCSGYGYHVTYSWKISISNDMESWTVINEQSYYHSGGGSSYAGISYNVPVEYQNYKYWKIENISYGGASGYTINIPRANMNNIIFNTAPANGDVITISYTTDCIPKDSDHVLDATFTLEFGEYTE